MRHVIFFFTLWSTWPNAVEFCLKTAKWIKKKCHENLHRQTAKYLKGDFFCFVFGCTIPLRYAFCSSSKKNKKQHEINVLFSICPLVSAFYIVYILLLWKKCALLVSAYRKGIRCVHYHMAGFYSRTSSEGQCFVIISLISLSACGKCGSVL